MGQRWEVAHLGAFSFFPSFLPPSFLPPSFLLSFLPSSLPSFLFSLSLSFLSFYFAASVSNGLSECKSGCWYSACLGLSSVYELDVSLSIPVDTAFFQLALFSFLISGGKGSLPFIFLQNFLYHKAFIFHINLRIYSSHCTKIMLLIISLERH